MSKFDEAESLQDEIAVAVSGVSPAALARVITRLIDRLTALETIATRCRSDRMERSLAVTPSGFIVDDKARNLANRVLALETRQSTSERKHTVLAQRVTNLENGDSLGASTALRDSVVHLDAKVSAAIERHERDIAAMRKRLTESDAARPVGGPVRWYPNTGLRAADVTQYKMSCGHIALFAIPTDQMARIRDHVAACTGSQSVWLS